METPQTTTDPQNSTEEFLKEVEIPAEEAMADGFNPPAPGPSPEPQGPPPYEPPAGGEPIFSSAAESEEPVAAEKPKYSEEYKKKTLRTYLQLEENGTAKLCCLITKTKDLSRFKYSEDSREMLMIACEPYMDTIIEALPAWLPIVLVYFGLKFDQVTGVIAVMQANKANQSKKADVRTMQAIANVIAPEQQGERKNFVLYNDGYYRNDRAGQYIKDREGDGKPKLEKPSLEDLDKILAVRNNHHADLICNAFGITPRDFARLGIILKTEA